jgi:hypothetical protein
MLEGVVDFTAQPRERLLELADPRVERVTFVEDVDARLGGAAVHGDNIP